MGFLSRSSRSASSAARRPDGSSLPLQTKLRKGRPGDAHEQEAERTAERVVHGPADAPPLAASIRTGVQRPPEAPAGAEEEEQPVRPLRRQADEEREEPVRTRTDEERDEPARPQMEEEEEPLRAQPEEEEPVRPRGEEGGRGAGAAAEEASITDPELERRLSASKARGRPLGPEIRTEMESRFGADLGHVRIHTDREAAELARRLNARAFAHGDHIYFAEGRYAPATVDGKRLLAHELTHVLQQTGRAERRTIRRQADDDAGGGDGGGRYEASGVVLDTERTPDPDDPGDADLQTLEIPSVEVPEFKSRHRAGWDAAAPHVVRRGSRGSTKQVSRWRGKVGGKTGDLLDLEEARSEGARTEDGRYFYTARGEDSDFFLFGTESELQERLVIPTWDHEGAPRTFQVDHVVEDQLGGDDQVHNYELLDASANASAGPTLSASINREIREALEDLNEAHPEEPDIPARSEVARVRSNYRVKFASQRFEGDVSGEPGRFWLITDFVSDVEQVVEDPRDDVESPMDPLRPMTGEEVENLGRDGETIFFVSATGGERVDKPGEGEEIFPRVFFVEWRPEEGAAPGEKAGTLVVDAYRSGDYEEREEAESSEENGSGLTIDPSYANQQWDVVKIAGIYGGYIDRDSVFWWVRRSLSLPGLSPIQLESMRLDSRKGIVARGKLMPTVPLVRDADIDVLVEGSDIQFRKTFGTGEIDVPEPFSITDTSLTVFWGTEAGLGVEGRTSFEIQQVGEGHLEAETSTGAGFALAGEFDFDSDLFDPASVEVTYRDQTFGVTGEIGITEGTVQGVESASIQVSYSEGELSAEGSASLTIPGVEEGTMSVDYSDEGWSIGGSFNLSSEVPGIRSGSLDATVSKEGSEEGYSLAASGTAQPDLPGIDSELSIEYEDGAVDIHGRAAYERGLLSGEIDVGATNRAVDEEGRPTGDPTETFVVYGGGSLTMQITPWLEGTVGVQYQPNGEMVVSGRIGLPDSIPVFDAIEVPERELFGIGFDIPIFAIPVGPKSIGLKATIRGGVLAYASIGPGTLEGLELSVEYNPDRVEDTRVQGEGRFVIPAEAGLKLAVRATVGLDVAIGGVEGGLEVAGGLGLSAAAEAAVGVDWTPATGLEFRATLSAHVQPKFVFNIDGVITAWFAWYEKEWRWRLAEYEYGSDMRFGVRLPVVYREGEPFDISYDDLEIERPAIDARSFLGGLIRNIRNER